MDPHFCAFSFVDRITVVQPGVSVRGRYAIPAGLESFPASLVAEAVGQLAAWAALAGANFERRPVAGIAGSIELLAAVQPGQILELAAELETADADAMAYGGSAHADGILVVRLQHCVGPMMSMEEFDDPRAMRERFAVLCGPGAEPGGFRGVPVFGLERRDGEVGRSIRATLQVPASADLFADHFPRRPVFPGSLLMHSNLQLAAALAGDIPAPASGGAWALGRCQM
jgi:3-hydroxymyristoyl/3-hydroxydecanoyl-(acyl carrier protein) dehydratase